MRMREYITALSKDWISLMSGIASILLSVWVLFFPPRDIYGSRTLILVAIIACLLVAPYRIWSKERDASAANSKETRLRSYIIDRLTEFVQKGIEVKGWGGIRHSNIENWGRIDVMHGHGPRVEKFLRDYLGEPYVQRYREKREEALEEIIKELFDEKISPGTIEPTKEPEDEA
jgi:hypothetical protein